MSAVNKEDTKGGNAAPPASVLSPPPPPSRLPPAPACLHHGGGAVSVPNQGSSGGSIPAQQGGAHHSRRDKAAADQSSDEDDNGGGGGGDDGGGGVGDEVENAAEDGGGGGSGDSSGGGGGRSSGGTCEVDVEEITSYLAAQRLAAFGIASPPVPKQKQRVLSSCDLRGVADLILSGRAKKIVTMCGAGISVSAGIPDFRTPGTGLYSQLERYNLPSPQAVFEIGFFRSNPNPFYMLAKELWPGNFNPTPTHHFIKLLHDKNLLQRCYTQNIDSLESRAGLPPDAVIAAHGNFDDAHCITAHCNMQHSVEEVRQAALRQQPLRCQRCDGLVKPDIVFFGEGLPERFHQMAAPDFEAADLLIVLGTSLVVQPFAGLIDYVDDHVPRLLINRERAGECTPWSRYRGFDFDSQVRDICYLGDCDAGVAELADLLGWTEELQQLIAAAGARAAGGGSGRAAAAVAAAAAAGGRGEGGGSSAAAAAAARAGAAVAGAVAGLLPQLPGGWHAAGPDTAPAWDDPDVDISSAAEQLVAHLTHRGNQEAPIEVLAALPEDERARLDQVLEQAEAALAAFEQDMQQHDAAADEQDGGSDGDSS